MRTKLILLLALLALCGSGWAQTTVKIADQTDLAGITDNTTSQKTSIHKYGVYSGSASANTPPYTTFTTNIASGCPGVTISTTAQILRPEYVPSTYYLDYYGHVMAIQPSGTTSYTFTITAPSGYKIKNYAMTALSTSGSNYFIITPYGSSSYSAKGYNEMAQLNVNVNATSTTFTVARATNSTSTLCISQFTVTLEKVFPFTYNVSALNGTFSCGDSGFGNSWYSADKDAQLSLTTNSGNNNMVVNKDNIPFRIHTDTYNIAVPFGYIITGWNINAYTTAEGTSTIKGETVSTNSNLPTTVSSSGLISRTASFAVSTQSPWIVVNSMTVTISEDPKTYIYDCKDLSSSKTYIIYGERGSWYSGTTSMTFVGTNDINKDDTYQQIALIPGTNGRIYAYSVTADKFLVGSETSGDPIGLSDQPEPIYITSTANSDYPWFFSFTNDKSAQNINISSGKLKVMTNNVLDAGNRFCICESNTSYSLPTAATTAITEYETAYVPVTYNLIFDGDVIKSIVHDKEIVGTSVSATTLFGTVPTYCTYGDPDVATIAANTTEVNIELSWDGPFAISSNYSDATWYYLTLRDKYVVLNTDGVTISSSETTKANAVAAVENGLWAIFGDPFNGLILKNKAAGEGLCATLVNNQVTQLATKNNTWSVFTIGQNGDGFTFYIQGYYINDVDGSFGWWNATAAATDTGSTMKVESVDYYDVATALLAWYEIPSDDFFGIRPVDKTAIMESISTAFGANHSLLDLATYDGTIKPYILDRIKYPESGKFYVIKNVSNSKYFNVKSAGGLFADLAAPMVGSVVQAQIRDGKTYFATQGKEFGWCYGSSNKALLDVANGGKYAHFSDVTVPGQIAFAHCIGNGEGSYAGYLPMSYYAVGENNQIEGNYVNAAAAQWKFEEATSVTVGLNGDGAGTYYATLCVPYSYTISGATAYTLERSGDWLIPTAIDGTVPAGTPVLLKGTSATATLTIGTDYVVLPVGTTVLTGTYLEKEIDGSTDYVLGINGGVVGFYHWDSNTLAANRAFLDIPAAGVKSFALMFDEEDATGIKTLDDVQGTTNDVIYNVAGQRMSRMQKGINIINGKKILK